MCEQLRGEACFRYEFKPPDFEARVLYITGGGRSFGRVYYKGLVDTSGSLKGYNPQKYNPQNVYLSNINYIYTRTLEMLALYCTVVRLLIHVRFENHAYICIAC